MNDKWLKLDGTRWGHEAKVRVARLFRHHVRTPSNPLGRIVRDPCWWCARASVRGDGPRLEHLPPGEAHHVDYERPFLVTWACQPHHREIDHGSRKVPTMALRDYSSLVHQRHGARRENRKSNPHPEAAADVGSASPF